MSTSERCDREDIHSRVKLERVGAGPRRRVVAVVGALIIFITVAWLKPWDRQPPPTAVALFPTGQPSATATAAPEEATLEPPATPVPATPTPPTPPPTVTPTLNPIQLAGRRAHCRHSQIWRLVSMEETARWRTRTMWGTTLQDASGPADHSLVAREDHADRLTAVGICAPSTPVMSAVDQLLQVVLWHVSVDGDVREITRPVIVDEPLFELGEAYYGPPADEGESWPAGRYVFEIRRIAGAGSRFLALDFVPTGPAADVVSP